MGVRRRLWHMWQLPTPTYSAPGPQDCRYFPGGMNQELAFSSPQGLTCKTELEP